MNVFEVMPAIAKEIQLPSDAEFEEAKRAECRCARLAATVCQSGTHFDTSENGKLVRRSTIDGLLLKIVPAKLRQVVLPSAHDRVSAEDSGSRRMYDTMRRAYYWQHMPYIMCR